MVGDRMNFQFATSAQIFFGPGTVKETGAITRVYGSRVLLVGGKIGQRSEYLTQNLQESGLEIERFQTMGEPTIQQIIDGTTIARDRKTDVILGVGGGSSIDAAKAIAAMSKNPGSIYDYLEGIGSGRVLTETALPVIAIPTTAGTGSEVTRNAVLTSPEFKVKISLRSLSMIPRVAIIDPELTYSLDPAITASSGMDALVQVIEPFVSNRSNPFTDLFCLDGISRIRRSLAVAFLDGRNVKAREDMAMGSLFGGLCLANSGLGAVHGFAGPIGGMFPNAPHGVICARLLVPVIQANSIALVGKNKKSESETKSLEKYKKLAHVLCANEHASINDACNYLNSLIHDLKIPELKEFGISRSNIPEIVNKAIKASSMKANPVILSEIELEMILKKSLPEVN
jgi:alcohol dehydrogenase class IV